MCVEDDKAIHLEEQEKAAQVASAERKSDWCRTEIYRLMQFFERYANKLNAALYFMSPFPKLVAMVSHGGRGKILTIM
jgi:hypothetical protein